MSNTVDFMKALEDEYRQLSGLKNRSQYKIFYGQVFPAPILTLGLNPGGQPDETSDDGTSQKDGSPASSSSSYFERMENDILDCEWRENAGLRKLLLPLVGGDLDRFRREIVKTNLAFRRSRRVDHIDLAEAKTEAQPILSKIIERVKPNLIVLTGPPIDSFLGSFARSSRAIADTMRAPGINHVVFAGAAATLGLADYETIVVQVAHASQFAWTYARYGIPDMIAELVSNLSGKECRFSTGVPTTVTTSLTPPPAIPQVTSTHGDVVPPRIIGGDARLSELDGKWQLLNIREEFWKVHHFSSPKFSGKPQNLNGFIAYCELRAIGAENVQTIKRALDLARRIQAGDDFEPALAEAWKNFPIVNR